MIKEEGIDNSELIMYIGGMSKMSNEYIEIVNEYKRFEDFLRTLAREVDDFLSDFHGGLTESMSPKAYHLLLVIKGYVGGALKILEGYDENRN